ncbi:YwdI family protein [Sediminibacillus massiliensis]|uniref:YwdI family protein n=1 Tax=Sediminibacillus massiliensis TaxID=1926277 RepID=UPI0009883266|nr:YwdI family protein [Sediminibacillus massiliensis]
MAISNQSVLNKMQKELKEAMAKEGQTNAVREHVRAVRLLCDLILDEDKGSGTAEQQELQAMMGNLETSLNKPSNVQRTGQQSVNTDHEEANGDSLFDF